MDMAEPDQTSPPAPESGDKRLPLTTRGAKRQHSELQRSLGVGSHLGAGDGDPLQPVLAHEILESQFQAHLAPTPAWAACPSTRQWHLGEKESGAASPIHLPP